MGTPIPMYVKYVLNLRLQQFFFHAVIFVVSILLTCLHIFRSQTFGNFPLDLHLFVWIRTSCLLFQCVNRVRLLVQNVQYAAQILRIEFLLLHLDPSNRGLFQPLFFNNILLWAVFNCYNLQVWNYNLLSFWLSKFSQGSIFELIYQRSCGCNSFISLPVRKTV